MSVGNGDGAFEEAGFLYPRGARHFAIAVLREPAGVDGVGILATTGEDDGNAGSHGSLTYD